MRPLVVSFGTLDKAAITAAKSLEWGELSNALTKEPPESSDKASRGWYIPATFSEAHRHGDFYVARDAITFDFDHVGIDAWGMVIGVLEEWGAFCLYTTFSHRYDAPRFRAVVPLSRAVEADVFQAITRKLAEKIGIELVAKESFVPCQFMYLPLRTFGGVFESYISENKKFLQVDELLNDYSDWTNRKEWPRRAQGDDIHEVTEGMVAPDEKPGLIGEFCRKFRVADAIRRFDLPYRTGSTEGRWTYAHGSVPDGAIEYDEGLKFHSHHDTDPCRGQNNAYDLVRLARFGHLDTGGHESLGVQDRPSSRAMADFVLSLPEFRPAASDEFGDFSVRSESAQAEILGEEKSDAAVHTPARFLVQSAADFSGGPPMAWIVRKLLPRAELAVIFGQPGSGKSFLAFDLCSAITRGVEWRGRKVESGRAVYVCAEGASGFKTRIRAYASGHHAPIHELPAVMADQPNLLDPVDALAVTKNIVEWAKAQGERK